MQIVATPDRLQVRWSNLMTRLIGLFLFVMGSIGLGAVLAEYSPQLQPAVILCCIFIPLGLFVATMMRKGLEYDLDRQADCVTVRYPTRFDTRHEVVRFPLGDLEALVLKTAVGAASADGLRGPRGMSGFDFRLRDGQRHHCGIYSTDHGEIEAVVERIRRFADVEVVADDQADVLWG